jgi:uncharacterized membrane protein
VAYSVILGYIRIYICIQQNWADFGAMIKIKINDTVIGYLILVMAILSAFKLVKINKFSESTDEFKNTMSQKIGNMIFVPALALAISSIPGSPVLDGTAGFIGGVGYCNCNSINSCIYNY